MTKKYIAGQIISLLKKSNMTIEDIISALQWGQKDITLRSE